MLGKRIYKTSMLNFFRLIVLAVVVFFLNDFYLETITEPKFWEMMGHPKNLAEKLFTFLRYHNAYPIDFMALFFTVLMPSIYYSFIRGVRFHEKGFVFNRGIPLLDTKVPYEEVKTYKLFHPNYAISLHTKSGESFIIADNSIERVIAILDQHNIKGDLAQDEFVKLFTNLKRVTIFAVSFVLLLFVVRKLGLYLNHVF